MKLTVPIGPVGVASNFLMCNSNQACEVGWAEKLPPTCPPSHSVSTAGEALCRFLVKKKPAATDFVAKPASGDDCKNYALSLWPEEGAIALLKLPYFKGKFRGRLCVTLVPGAGVLTSGMSGRYGFRHYSWWKCAAFDPMPPRAKTSAAKPGR